MIGPFDPDFDEPLLGKFEKEYHPGHVVELKPEALFGGMSDPLPVARSSTRPPAIEWFAVSAANLIVPGLLGLVMTNPSGKVGMLLGVLIVVAIGNRACFHAPDGSRTVILGGWFVACCQLLPIFQIMAGATGVGMARQFRLADVGEAAAVDTVFGGLIATVVTGMILVAFAGFLGSILRAFGRLIEVGRAENPAKW